MCCFRYGEEERHGEKRRARESAPETHREPGRDPPARLSRGDARVGAALFPGDGNYPRGRYHRAGHHRPPGFHCVPAEFKSGHGIPRQGTHLAAAKASGVMESIEAFMAERITRPLVLGSVNDLRSSHPLVTSTCAQDYGLGVPPGCPCLGSRGGNCSPEPRWVPYEMVHTAYTLPRPTGTGCFIATSNGLASGNHLLEAISHAICDGGTRRGHAARRAGAGGYGVAPDRPADRGRSRLR